MWYSRGVCFRSRENVLMADLALATQDKARLESALGNMRQAK